MNPEGRGVRKNVGDVVPPATIRVTSRLSRCAIQAARNFDRARSRRCRMRPIKLAKSETSVSPGRAEDASNGPLARAAGRFCLRRIMKLSVGEHCATHLRDPGSWLRDRRARSGGRLLAPRNAADAVVDSEELRAFTVAMRMASRGVKPASTRSLTAFVRRESWYAESGTRIRSEHEAPTSLDELQRERPLISRRRWAEHPACRPAPAC